MAAALLLALALATAQPVDYEREGGTGTLTIMPSAKGTKKFGLSTFGANAHTCELGGTIKGNQGTLYDHEPGEPECRITFTQKGDMIEVTAQSQDACSSVCGVRATFEGRYFLPPPACTAGASKEVKDAFLAQYKAKHYQQAYDTLNGWLDQCSYLLHWMESDRVLNDLALAQYHMQQPAACLATLAKTYAAEMKTIKAVEEELPPADYDAYASTAKATFHNQKLCGKQ